MARPTRIRYTIYLLALLVDMTSYMDRVCISVAAPALEQEFALSKSQMGWVFSIFSLAYFLGQTPWGMLADRLGARNIVAGAIVWWSAFTALTGAAWSYVSLLFIRFWFGAVEAALSPSIASAFSRWAPVGERSTAFGAFLSGGRIGGAVAPPIAAALLLGYGWRTMFMAFAGLGLLWAVAWRWWYRNTPREHPRINAEELAIIEAGLAAEGPVSEDRPGPWRLLKGSPQLVLLLGVSFGYTVMWQFYITWFPTYLIEERGFSLEQAGFVSGLPFLFGVAANWVGGLLTDALCRRMAPSRARRLVGFAGLLTAGALMLAGILAPWAMAGALLMALAAFAGDMMLGPFWASTISAGGNAGGTAGGLANAASNLGGFVSPVVIGWALDQWGDWNAVLLLTVAANFAAAALWWPANRPKAKAA
ncbi:MAG: MFS transporter [Acidobacteria bacterium]|nr:MFS transporter [Acidobacteriota bacterium]